MTSWNWLAKADDVVALAKEQAVLHWEIAAAFALVGAAIAIIIAAKRPSLSDSARSKARILRYCHNCTYADLTTETCAIDATSSEKCALIDSTAGIEWTIPTKVP